MLKKIIFRSWRYTKNNPIFGQKSRKDKQKDTQTSDLQKKVSVHIRDQYLPCVKISWRYLH